MAGKNHDVIHIKTYKTKGSWNVGLFLFGIIFLYLFVTVADYLTQEKVSIYEVREGSILQDTSFTGLIVRDETVYYADADGYINYFLPAGSKIGVQDSVYALSEEALPSVADQEQNEETSVTTDDWGSILAEAQTFHETYSAQNFDTAVRLKNDISDILKRKTSQNRTAQLSSILGSGEAGGISVVQSPHDGIIEYTVDGYEGLRPDEITDDQLLRHDYKKTEHADNTKISAGTPVYKLITDEEWTLIIKLTDDMEKFFREMEQAEAQKAKEMGRAQRDIYAKIRFLKDNEEQWASLKIYNRGKEDAYGYLTFSSGMIRYALDRYLDIELILVDESGLKIPKSSVAEKEFYAIPEAYLTTGGASRETGVLRKSADDMTTRFEPVDVYYRDKEEGIVYVDTSVLNKGDTIVMSESSDSMEIKETKSLKGVYNINKGYAVFKRINILCENEEYYIIEEGSAYGPSNYDRIALDGSAVREDQIINQ